MAPRYPTEEELALEQEAVSRAYDEWLAEWEDRIEVPDPPAGASEVPSFAELAAAPPEAQEDLTRRIAAAKAKLHHPTLAVPEATGEPAAPEATPDPEPTEPAAGPPTGEEPDGAP